MCIGSLKNRFGLSKLGGVKLGNEPLHFGASLVNGRVCVRVAVCASNMVWIFLVLTSG